MRECRVRPGERSQRGDTLPGMELRRFGSTADFLALAGEFLLAREAEHNLIFGICSNLEANPGAYGGPPYLAAVMRGGDVVAAALRTPPFRLVLSEVDDPAAVALLAADLAEESLPGVQGPKRWAAMFAEAWAARGGADVEQRRGMRIFRLAKVRPPRKVQGRMRAAEPADRDLVVHWLRAFHDEAVPEEPLLDYEEMAARWLRGEGRRLVVWVDDGQVVSLAGIGGRTPNGIRIGPVYTPPELRGRGYASNLVAAASQAELDAGRRFLFLFTDLGNPTSNKIYQQIGYEPVTDVDEFAFVARGARPA